MNLNTLKTGDLIVRQKGLFSTHYIVWIGWRDGVPLVAENHNGHGVWYTNLNSALAGNRVIRTERFGGTEAQRAWVIPMINGMIGKSYNLVVFNCEHFARWVSSGKTESKQVKLAANLILAMGGYLVTRRNVAARNLGIALLVIGAVIRLTQ